MKSTRNMTDKQTNTLKSTEKAVKTKKVLSNRRALKNDALTYELERFKEKKLIIFNQETIKGCSKRVGTEIDVAALKKTFGDLDFDVVEHKDFEKKEIFAELEAFTDSENDLSDYGCLAVAILTHGTLNGRLRAKDDQYSEKDIIDFFKTDRNLTLRTKPRLLIIQACRGDEDSSGANVHNQRPFFPDSDSKVIGPSGANVHSPEPIYVPDDMLILHSCYAGKPSYRNDIHGSWFIQELCKMINQDAATKDLDNIMRDVKRVVSLDKDCKEINKGTSQISKQMPVITSTLVRKLYLKKHEVSQNVANTNLGGEFVDGSPSIETVGLEPSSCFVDLYFNFMKRCLKFHVEDQREDASAFSFLEIANTFQETAEFRVTKVTFNGKILDHLIMNGREYQEEKSVYFYRLTNT